MNTGVKERERIYSDTEILMQKELDEAMVKERWEAVESGLCKMTSQKNASDIISALKEMYSLYKDEAVAWYANLYDPKHGGFYYSNSARDNDEVECEGKIYKLLPDLESTNQSFSFIASSHMADKFGKDVTKALPEWMKEQIVPFVKNMQDKETGYFYHPQWGKERADKWTNRRGRDLTWATRLLEDYGESPLYNTPLEERSEDKKSGGTATAENLKDKESFLAFLNSLGFDSKNAYSAYVVGNKLEAQALEICARDRELEKEGVDYRLLTVMKEWLDERFNPATGAWTEAEFSHDTVNGILKISSTYMRAGLTLPDPILSIKAAIRCVTIDQEPEHVCCVLNPWYALNTIVSSIRRTYGEDGNMLGTLEQIQREVLKSYPEMIRKTTENLKLFLKEDGSFSYFHKRSSHYSQMMPVALPNTNEGDMNASMICTVAIPSHIFNYLGICSVPIYTESDRMRLVNILIKRNKALKEGEEG